MTFAVIDWLSISINLLLVIFVIVCLLMTLLILMQRPRQEGLGAAFGGGVTDQVFGARTTNVLQRGTVWLGSIFFILALVLAILIGMKNRKSGLLNEKKPAVEEQQPETGDANKAAPAESEGMPKSLSNELPDAQPGDTGADKVEAPAPDQGAADQTPGDVEKSTPEAGAPAESGAAENSADKPAQP